MVRVLIKMKKVGFEPTRDKLTDLQSVAFDHSAIFSIYLSYIAWYTGGGGVYLLIRSNIKYYLNSLILFCFNSSVGRAQG